MTEYEFMPGMDDDDPIVLPGGESHTVGQARADRKLQRRISFASFMRSGMRDRLVHVLQRLETEPDLDQRELLWIMREDAVAVALAAFDKIEGIEKRRRHNGQIARAERSPARTKAKHEKRWGERAREILCGSRGTISAAHIHTRLVESGLALKSELRTVERFVAEIKKEGSGDEFSPTR